MASASVLSAAAYLVGPIPEPCRVNGNEAAAIAHIRAVLDAEAAYAADNGGRFGDVECLRQIRSGEERYGYRWRFLPRRTIAPTHRGDIEGFVIVAEPARRDNRHGFAADESGRICATDVPSVVLTDGTIRPECRPLH